MLHIKLHRITIAATWWQILCLQTTHLTLAMGSIGQKSTFSGQSHVAYQIKGNHELQQHGSKYFVHRPPPPLPSPTLGMGSICQIPTPTTLGDGVKIQLFQNLVMLHIKLKRTTNAATWQQIFFPQTPLPLQPHTPTLDTGDGVNWSKFNFFRTWLCCISN